MMTWCRKLVLWLWFLAVCNKVTTSRGLEISCISNERKVKFKQLDSDAGNSSLMFALNGSTLTCSCKRNNSDLLTDLHLAWAINGKHFNQTWQNNYTVKITLPVVDWNYNKSVFECKVINACQTIKHTQFLLIVGDRPSPPMNLEVDSFLQRPRFTWTASRFTGNLRPVIYTVRFSARSPDFPECNNFAAPCLGNEVSSQEEFVHVQGEKYSCILQTHNFMTCIYNSLQYKVWVAAKNEVGSTNSLNVLEIQPEDFTYANSTIHAPEEVSVTNITDTGFKVSFRKGKLWVIEDLGPFRDHYSTKLKLAVIGNSARQIVKYDSISLKGHILVEDLTPWTLYSMCLQVRIVSVVYHESTAFSPSKCSVVRTKQARPSVPPTITSCNSTAFSNNSMAFKKISWSMPPNHSWNSPWLEGFRLIYLRRDEVPEVQKEHVVIIGNSSTSFGLPVPFCATVDVWIELCNAAGLCSRRSNKCRILPLAKTADPNKPDIRRWANDDVSCWLKSIGLSSVSNKVREWLDGKMLIRLHNLRRESPEFFYSSIKDELDLKHLPQVLTFADELEKLTG